MSPKMDSCRKWRGALTPWLPARNKETHCGVFMVEVNDVCFPFLQNKRTNTRQKNWYSIELVNSRPCCRVATVMSSKTSLKDLSTSFLMKVNLPSMQRRFPDITSNDAYMFTLILVPLISYLDLLFRYSELLANNNTCYLYHMIFHFCYIQGYVV